jgi:hypothetical protein
MSKVSIASALVRRLTSSEGMRKLMKATGAKASKLVNSTKIGMKMAKVGTNLVTAEIADEVAKTILDRPVIQVIDNWVNNRWGALMGKTVGSTPILKDIMALGNWITESAVKLLQKVQIDVPASEFAKIMQGYRATAAKDDLVTKIQNHATKYKPEGQESKEAKEDDHMPQNNEKNQVLNKIQFYKNLPAHSKLLPVSNYAMNIPDDRSIKTPRAQFMAHHIIFNRMGRKGITNLNLRFDDIYTALKGIRGLSYKLPYEQRDLYQLDELTTYTLTEFFRIKACINACGEYSINSTIKQKVVVEANGFDFNDFKRNLADYKDMLGDMYSFIRKRCPVLTNYYEKMEEAFGGFVPDCEDLSLATYHFVVPYYLYKRNEYVLDSQTQKYKFTMFGAHFKELSTEDKFLEIQELTQYTFSDIEGAGLGNNNPTMFEDAQNQWEKFRDSVITNSIISSIKGDLFAAFGAEPMYENPDIIIHEDNSVTVTTHNYKILNFKNNKLWLDQLSNSVYVTRILDFVNTSAQDDNTHERTMLFPDATRIWLPTQDLDEDGVKSTASELNYDIKTTESFYEAEDYAFRMINTRPFTYLTDYSGPLQSPTGDITNTNIHDITNSTMCDITKDEAAYYEVMQGVSVPRSFKVEEVGNVTTWDIQQNILLYSVVTYEDENGNARHNVIANEFCHTNTDAPVLNRNVMDSIELRFNIAREIDCHPGSVFTLDQYQSTITLRDLDLWNISTTSNRAYYQIAANAAFSVSSLHVKSIAKPIYNVSAISEIELKSNR